VSIAKSIGLGIAAGQVGRAAARAGLPLPLVLIAVLWLIVLGLVLATWAEESRA